VGTRRQASTLMGLRWQTPPMLRLEGQVLLPFLNAALLQASEREETRDGCVFQALLNRAAHVVLSS
jgi:hypothetical protein